MKTKVKTIDEIAQMIVEERTAERLSEQSEEEQISWAYEFVIILLEQSDYSIEKIAEIVNVPVSFVQGIKDKRALERR